MFITFEGVDGSGKTTQAKTLVAFLQGAGLPAVYTREPGDTKVGARLREILLEEPDIDPIAEYLIFAADRAEHMRSVKALLDGGHIVISDRYIGSSLAYQGIKGVTQDFMLSVFFQSDCVLPDLTLWIDLPAKVAHERAQFRGLSNVYDNKEVFYYQRLKERYESLSSRFDWTPIDAEGHPMEVHKRVLTALLTNPQANFKEDIYKYISPDYREELLNGPR